MLSKILIDVDEQGLSTIRVTGVREEFDGDVRDKLVKRFLEGGMFALITRDENNDAEIHSMNVLDVLENIHEVYSDLFPEEMKRDFEQSIYKVCSLLEEVSGERSTAFNAKVKAQSLV